MLPLPQMNPMYVPASGGLTKGKVFGTVVVRADNCYSHYYMLTIMSAESAPYTCRDSTHVIFLSFHTSLYWLLEVAFVRLLQGSVAFAWGVKKYYDERGQGSGDSVGWIGPPISQKTASTNTTGTQVTTSNPPFTSKQQVPQIMKAAAPYSTDPEDSSEAEALLSSVGSMEAGSPIDAERGAGSGLSRNDEKTAASGQADVLFEI